MPDIMFRNKPYSFENSALNLQYFDSGDLHGNDNFRTQSKPLLVYEALQQIEPALLHSALAATINGVPAPLTAKINQNCTLDIITVNEPAGKIIYYQSLAFLVAQTMYALNADLQLTSVNISESQCTLQFVGNAANCGQKSLDEYVQQTIENNAAIQLIDAFQKEMLMETYPSLSQPYAQTILAQYDAYDFVPVAVRQNFVLPVAENDIFVANPKLITDFTLSQSIENDIFTIVAARNPS